MCRSVVLILRTNNKQGDFYLPMQHILLSTEHQVYQTPFKTVVNVQFHIAPSLCSAIQHNNKRHYSHSSKLMQCNLTKHVALHNLTKYATKHQFHKGKQGHFKTTSKVTIQHSCRLEYLSKSTLSLIKSRNKFFHHINQI